MDYRAYLETTYASWLGKLIGIRLGAPVENFAYQQIIAKYGEVKDYLIDYDIFAADDDSNGPLFFVRALLDNDPKLLTAKDMGDTILNYLEEYHGFFWWGGVGVSTEHTAYENLKNGIKAPKSGSVEQNGIALAEQIGGQIFSDCWGYVSGYDPKLAKELAIKAASATHDGNGIQGAIFVAVAICLAYQSDDRMSVIEETLKYLDPNMAYSKIVREIMAFYRDDPSDWHRCLKYIHENHGYDRYPGVCHIIPNTALMIMALCYGENDFTKTLTMLCESGWDTDCNCGNVGSIMGAIVGLEGIEARWIKPINDTINCSSMIGYLNNTTVSNTAFMFTDIAFNLKGQSDNILKHNVYDFSLPYATNGFRAINGKLLVEDNCLKVTCLNKSDVYVYKYSYYLPNTIYDTRYEPAFSPLLYPNEVISFKLRCESSAELGIFIKDSEQQIHKQIVQKVTGECVLSYRIPMAIKGIVCEFGIYQKASDDMPDWSIMNVSVKKTPHFKLDLSELVTDHYGEVFGGGTLDNIQGWVTHSGDWQISDKGLVGQAKKGQQALITSGDIDFSEHTLTVSIEPLQGFGHYIILNCCGNLHYTAIGLCDGGVEIIEKNIIEKRRIFMPFDWDFHTKFILKTISKNGIIRAMINGIAIGFENANIENGNGIYGFLLKDDSICRFEWFELASPI